MQQLETGGITVSFSVVMAENSIAIVLCVIRPHMGQFLPYKISYMNVIKKKKELQSS